MRFMQHPENQNESKESTASGTDGPQRDLKLLFHYMVKGALDLAHTKFQVRSLQAWIKDITCANETSLDVITTSIKSLVGTKTLHFISGQKAAP